MAQSPNAKESKIRVQNNLLIIKNVPARVCDLCDEAYISPEASRRIDINRLFNYLKE